MRIKTGRSWSLAWCLVLALPVHAKTIYVDVDATGQGTGATWTDAYTSLSAAIKRSSTGDELWVAEGVYGPIVLKDGISVYGGFTGAERSVTESDPRAHKTLVSGRAKSRAVTAIGNGNSTVLRGVYVTEGYSEFPDMGAGAYLENSNAMFVRCVFTANRSKFFGGAVMIWGGSPSFVNCRFHDNDGGWAAGAVLSRKNATPTFVNCLFTNNTAQEAGAISVVSGGPTFINCTIAGNKATVGKGGALFDAQGEAVIRNCILWGNASPVSGAAEIFNPPSLRSATSVSHSVVKAKWPGADNLDTDPLFVDSANGDYRLKADSPCREKGESAALPNDSADIGLDGNTSNVLPYDLDMKARIDGVSVDIGALEWHSTP